MITHTREWAGAFLSGSAVVLASLIIANYFAVPGKPVVWVVVVGGLAGLAGAIWIYLLPGMEEKNFGRQNVTKLAHCGLPWQVNRLFLFNTLHNAAALTLADPEKARTVIEIFADYLRVVNEINQTPVTLLNLEIRCAEMFLSIERARFGDRLHVVEDVAPDCLEDRVPSLALQPLVAYAVRSGVEKSDTTVQITLKAWHEAKALLMEVRQDGPAESDPIKRERLLVDLGFPELYKILQRQYGRGAGIEYERLEPRGGCVRIRLPRN